MCGCLVLFVGAAFPRIALVLTELFTDWNDRAFESFWTGFVGWLLLPYTTLFYVLMENWQEGINGFGWFVVAFGFILDVSHYISGLRKRNQEWIVERRVY